MVLLFIFKRVKIAKFLLYLFHCLLFYEFLVFPNNNNTILQQYNVKRNQSINWGLSSQLLYKPKTFGPRLSSAFSFVFHHHFHPNYCYVAANAHGPQVSIILSFNRNRNSSKIHFLKNGPFPASISLFLSFQYSWQ